MAKQNRIKLSTPLAACPYCRDDQSLAASPRVDGHGNLWSVSCASCGMIGPLAADETGAVEVWAEFAALTDDAPRNRLVDSDDTLAHVTALLTWHEWHPRKDGEPSPEVADELALADLLVSGMMRDALEHERLRKQ